ncbi:MAG: helix-turn-helix transcriptional regulator [Leptolyngbyaceae cyanobacterium RU_5_1]|nr:helix-turn-helix transcriptional regulator [Leptolyngbyaceae cyanobacterium RU_5_1]
MAASKALRIHVTGKELTKIYPNGALLSNHATDWGGLYLQYYRQSPFEMVEHSCPQHRIIINDRALRSPIIETFEGENQLNPVSYGTVRVLPGNSRSWAYWETEHQFMMLAFEPELLIRQIADTTDVNSVELLPIINPADPLIYNIGLTLKAELESGGIGGRLYVDAMAMALMAHLLRHYSIQNCLLPSIVNGLPKRILRQVVDYIHDHLDHDLTLETLAAIARMSRWCSRSVVSIVGSLYITTLWNNNHTSRTLHTI